MNPLISVVVPTYNNAATIQEALSSAVEQEAPLEVLVVDDGSSDGTPSLVLSYGDPRIRLLSQEHRGPAEARNLGMAAARGEWIAFLDADDRWLPGKVQRQLDLINADPELRFVFGGERVIYWDGRELDHCYDGSRRSLFLDLLWGNRFATPSVMVHREALAAVRGFDGALRTGEDWDLWLRLAAWFPCAWLAEPVVCVRRRRPNDNPVSLRTLEFCVFRVLDRVFSDPEIAARWPQITKLRPYVYGWHASVLARSYARHRLVGPAVRLAIRAVCYHPSNALSLIVGKSPKWLRTPAPRRTGK